MRLQPGPTLFKYALREPVLPTLMALASFTFLFLTADLAALADLFVNQGVGLARILQITGFDLLPAAARSIPFAVLIGTHVALGRLGSDLEIIAMRASGVPARQLFAPVAAFGLIGTAVATLFWTVLSPWALAELDRVWAERAQAKPESLLQAGTLYRLGDWRLEALAIDETGLSLSGIAMWVPELEEMVFARDGQIDKGNGDDPRFLVGEGSALFGDDRGLLHFQSAERAMPLPEAASLQLSDGPSALSMRGLRDEIASTENSLVRDEAIVEFHRRLAMPLSTLGFALLALPLSLSRRRPSRSGGIALGLGAAVGYYGLIYLSAGVAQGGAISPAESVWAPNLGLGLLCAFLLFRMAREPVPKPDRKPRAKTEDADEAPKIRAHSYVLSRYLLREFLATAVLCLGTLVLVLWLADVLDNLKWFARYRATPLEIARFYGPRLLVLGSRALPLALLGAAALTIARIGLRGELAGMRACGVSVRAIAIPVLLPCIVATAFSLALHAEWLPRAHALATRVKRTEIKEQAPAPPTGEVTWHRRGRRVYVARPFDPVNGIATDLRIYLLDGNGLPIERTQADEARHIGDGIWRLLNPRRVVVDQGRVVVANSPAQTTLGGAAPDTTESDQLTLGELQSVIAARERGGYPTTGYRTDFHAKLAWPFACFALPAVGLLLGLRAPPRGRVTRPLLFAAGVGAGHFLLSSLGTSLGYSGTVPPLLGAWTPQLILGGVALHLAVRSSSFQAS